MKFRITAVCMLVLTACSQEAEQKTAGEAAAPPAEIKRETGFAAPTEAPIDKFTYANYTDVRVTNADLTLNVDFDDKVIDGVAVLDLEYLNPDADKIILDTNDLDIKSVEARFDGTWRPAGFRLGADDPLLGSRLQILPRGKPEQVRITYSTSPGANGLQWLSAEQTAGKKHPYLFSQFEEIQARSMAPLQDTPAVRMTYSAHVTTSPDLVALMSAEQDDGPRDGDYTFKMPQPIPSYLIAIAVGDIAFRSISDNVGVYSEDDMVDAAAKEFEDTPKMVDAISALYGPYRWGRYDMLVLPPSFPFGGMENPRLTFLTPTVIAGDKSLTNTVAHELAHSWSGNLVTNATWRDAWLNEGVTSYVENRVMEALYGEKRAVMERALDLESLKQAIAEADRPELTSLKMPEDMENPDDAFSDISYVKGAFFLKFLETRFGRDKFDAFMKDYFDHFAFHSIVTEDFLAYFSDHLWADNPGAVTKAEIEEWVYGQGLPSTIETPVSDAFKKVSEAQAKWLAGDIAASDLPTDQWTTHEWLHFINTLPDDLSQDQFAALDAAFSLSTSQNAEIAFAWYMKAIPGDYEPAMAPLKDFLIRVGRGKFIYKLYETLIAQGRREWAAAVYEKARPGYHPLAQRRIDEIFAAASSSSAQ